MLFILDLCIFVLKIKILIMLREKDRKYIILVLLCYFFNSPCSRGDDSLPHVAASVFYETFDGTADLGGNDDRLSGYLSSNTQIIYDEGGWVLADSYKPSPCAQCVRLGSTSGDKYVYIKTRSVPISNNSILLKYRAAPFLTTKSSKIYLEINSSKSSVTLNSGFQNYTKEISLDASDVQIGFLTAYSSSSSYKQAYFFLDDVAIFQNDATASQQGDAAKIILKGPFTPADINALNENIAENKKLVFIDASEATFSEPQNTEIKTPSSPNCLIYLSTGRLANNSNVVVGNQCENLIIKDGYPFHSDVDFKAVNVSYDRSFSETGSNYVSTVCLPFSISKNQCSGITRLALFDSYNKIDGVLNFTTANEVVSNKPCLIWVKDSQPFLNLNNVNADVSASYNTTMSQDECFITFAGIYSRHTNIKSNETGGNNPLVFGYSGGTFYKIPSSAVATFQPFRAFFSIEGQFVSSQVSSTGFPLAVDGLTNIETIRTKKIVNANVYDVNGHCILRNVSKNRVNELPVGFYIYGGKKILVK